MSESKKLIPRRRFHSFIHSDDWSLMNLENLGDFNPSSLLPNQFEYVDLESVVGNQMVSHRTLDRKQAPSRAQRLAKKGDIFYQTVRPYQQNNYFFNLIEENYVFSTGYAQIRPFVDGYFLFTKLQEKKFLLEVLDNCIGTSFPAISSTALAKIRVFTPLNKEEQYNIGNFFQKLDNLINTQQKKLEKAKTLKSAYLTEMFPNEGELKPRYRFLGFKKDWSITQFKNLANIRRGLTYTPSNLALDGVRILRSSNIDSDRFILRNDDIFIDQIYVSISLVKENDILITSANGSSRLVGKHALIKITNNEKAVHGGFMLLATSNQPFFTNAIMSSNWYRKFLNTYVAGGNGAIGNLNKTELANQDISIPTTLEQTKIGNFFKLLDDKIALEQKKLAKLKNIKQAYLNEMFV
jgi:type I restriction enzyme, S subunit